MCCTCKSRTVENFLSWAIPRCWLDEVTSTNSHGDVMEHLANVERAFNVCPRTFVGRGLREGLVENIRYTLFWVAVLASKFTFTYFLQIKPTVASTRAVLNFKNIRSGTQFLPTLLGQQLGYSPTWVARCHSPIETAVWAGQVARCHSPIETAVWAGPVICED
uniref:Uncharacterized protein n=1 Tax=Nelumbo nucifera TaxID=4432 RepID=A0A822XRE2_NELNU|nr:TPA_asm: hypothetical protein HUJ06_024360 [Nelumbo nucifera]